MAKVITADNFTGQKLLLSWYGYHSTTSTVTLFPTGSTTTYPYAYSVIAVPFDGELSRVVFRNAPYGSYSSGATGSSATLSIYKNGVLYTTNTQTYTAGTAGQYIVFSFTNATFSANDSIEFRFACDGIWRYYSLGIELKET